MSGKVIQKEKSLSQLRALFWPKKKKMKVIYNSPESGKHCPGPSQAGTNVSYSLLCKSAREMQGWKQHKIIHGVNSPTQCGHPGGLFLLCVLVGASLLISCLTFQIVTFYFPILQLGDSGASFVPNHLTEPVTEELWRASGSKGLPPSRGIAKYEE